MACVNAISPGPLVGHKLKDLTQHLPDVEARVAAIYRQDRPIIPEGETVIQNGDEVFFIADRRHIRTNVRANGNGQTLPKSDDCRRG